MKRNVVEMVLGAVVLLVAAYFLVFSYKASNVKSTNGYAIHANFAEIGGLSIGSDVRMSGVKIGNVSSITLDQENYLAKVTMSIASDVKLPEDSSASVASESLMGGNFLNIEPGAAEESIANNGYIQYTQDAQNLEKLLGRFIFSLQGSESENETAE
jgi:phospholipid/cholesterol/gamma-HCH transport system substrate-binding protein